MTDASSKLPAVEIVVRTDPGRDPDKQVNEDSSIYKETKHGWLAVVCDGMGGHAGGKEASELAIATIVEIVEAAPLATPAGVALKRAIEEANARVWTMPTAEAGFRPGSTVVAALVHDGGVEIAHVGDSRLYLVHAGAISQVTRDHSMVQEMVDRNLIRAEDAAKHPDANKILRALGIGKDVEVDLRAEPLGYVNGDTLVLCSDGLSDLVEPGEILEIAGAGSPAQAAGQLVDLANARGGHDNITAMLLRMKASATSREPRALVKTIPLTAHGMPTDQLPQQVAPGSTVVAAPYAPSPGVVTPMPLPHGHAPPMSQPHHLASAPPSGHGRSRAPMLALGILLAVVAVGIVGVAVVLLVKRPHMNVRVVENPGRDAGTEATDEDGGPSPEATFVPAPTLTPEASGRWKKSDGGIWDSCASARKARERDASAADVDRLEARCRAAGGIP